MSDHRSITFFMSSLILVGIALLGAACAPQDLPVIDEFADELEKAEPTLFPSPTPEPSPTATSEPVRRVSFSDESDDVFNCSTGEPVSGFALVDLSEVTLELVDDQLKVTFAFHGVEDLESEIAAQGSFFAVAAKDENPEGTEPIQARGMFGLGTQYLDVKYAGGTWVTGVAKRTNGEFELTDEPVETDIEDDSLNVYVSPVWGPGLTDGIGFGVHGIDECDVLGIKTTDSDDSIVWYELLLALPDNWEVGPIGY